MARHQDRKRISAERLPDGTRRTRRAEPRRDLAVRARRARRNRARNLVDAAMERRHAIEVERDGGKIDALAAQQRGDALERTRDGGRRRRFVRLRKAPDETPARFPLVRLRKLHGEDAAPAPSDRPIAVSNSVNPWAIMPGS